MGSVFLSCARLWCERQHNACEVPHARTAHMAILTNGSLFPRSTCGGGTLSGALSEDLLSKLSVTGGVVLLLLAYLAISTPQPQYTTLLSLLLNNAS